MCVGLSALIRIRTRPAIVAAAAQPAIHRQSAVPMPRRRGRIAGRGGLLPEEAANWAIFFGGLGLGLMQSLFSFYYVKVYLNVFHIDEYWFNVAQSFFLVWNAVNDPLCGYLQDVGGSWMRERWKIFVYLGPLMSASFLVVWFPWGNGKSPGYVEGLHLITALGLYDAFYSCIGVAWSAFYTESTRDHGRRVKGLKYAQVANLCSMVVITVADKLSMSLEVLGGFGGCRLATPTHYRTSTHSNSSA